MNLKKIVAAMALTGLLANVSGCGVLLHPERQGQTGGNLDVAIVLLDGIGLLFFVVPGLIAFGIDFYQGTIYLPGGRASRFTDDGLRAVKIEGEISEESIEAAIFEHTGQIIDLSANNVQAQRITPEQLGIISVIARQNMTKQNVMM
ncbi:MAG: hypothetical protein U5M23_01780 [Marinagarivorans sp.]|nr:hypothetical protein [Marinagarivorans sp.]